MNDHNRLSVAKLLLSLLKAGCYLLLFLGAQTGIASLAVAAVTLTRPELSGEGVQELVMGQAALISLISSLLTLAVLVVFFLIRRKNLWKEISPGKADLSQVGAAAALAPALYLVAILLLTLMPKGWMDGYADASSGLGASGLLPFVSAVILAPLVEETVFRGLIQSRLGRAMPGWVAALLTALVFGLCHGQIVWVLYSFLLGFLLGRMRQASDSILPSLAAHTVFNLIGHLIAVLESRLGAMTLLEALLAFTVAGLIVSRRQIGRLFGIGRKNRADPV